MSKTLVILLSLIISLISVSYADKPFSVDQSFGGQVPAEGEPLTLVHLPLGPDPQKTDPH